MTPPKPFQRIAGIDFSANRQDAGSQIWIAEATGWDRDVLSIASLRRAQDLPGGGRAAATAVEALRNHVAGRGPALIGVDVPFGLPMALLGGATDWVDWLDAFRSDHATAEDFRDWCRRRTGGKELRRLTDREARTPFCAYNLRLYRQTHLALTSLLAPLVARGLARVAPMQQPEAGRPLLAEVCPASTLRRLGLYRAPYKGRGAAEADRRQHLLAALATMGVRVPDDLGHVVVNDRGGDALDGVLVAFAAWRTLVESPSTVWQPRGDADRLEGRVYF